MENPRPWHVPLFVFHKLFHKLRIVRDWGNLAKDWNSSKSEMYPGSLTMPGVYLSICKGFHFKTWSQSLKAWMWLWGWCQQYPGVISLVYNFFQWELSTCWALSFLPNQSLWAKMSVIRNTMFEVSKHRETKCVTIATSKQWHYQHALILSCNVQFNLIQFERAICEILICAFEG